MAFSIKDKATDEAVRRLARLKNTSLTEAIREAVVHEYDRTSDKTPLQDKLARFPLLQVLSEDWP